MNKKIKRSIYEVLITSHFVSYHTGKTKTLIGFLLSLTTQINLMGKHNHLLRVQKTALEKQIGNALWDNHATILLSTVKADYVFKLSNIG